MQNIWKGTVMKNESEIDKALWAELECENPSEGRIRSLVEQGANIKGEFLSNVILSLVPNLDYGGKVLNLKYIELLINLGAEVNYREDEGFNSLWEASICIYNSELVALLLLLGADPNSYSKENQSTILSAVIFDEWVGDRSEEESAELFKCMVILKKYGAKTNREFSIYNEAVGNEKMELLWKELNLANPVEEMIRKLVKDGADISGVFLKNCIYSLMPKRDHAGRFFGNLPDFKIFNLLVELGADLNFEDDTFNCLFESSQSWNPGLVKLLLALGANPNSISSKEPESILDYVNGEYKDRKRDYWLGDKINYQRQIIVLLEDYGAKSYSEFIN